MINEDVLRKRYFVELILHFNYEVKVGDRDCFLNRF